jgi:hypothetical protein
METSRHRRKQTNRRSATTVDRSVWYVRMGVYSPVGVASVKTSYTNYVFSRFSLLI